MGELKMPRRAGLGARVGLGLGLLAGLAGCAGASSLHGAAMRGDLDRLNSLIEDGWDVNRPDPAGEYPLHFGVYEGNTAVVRRLLDAGARVDQPDRRYGLSALTIAAHQGDVPMAELLLDYGADIEFEKPTEPDPNVERTFAYNAFPQSLTREAPAPPLLAAIAAGQMDMVRLLLARGADPDATDLQGQNALIIAARQRNTELARLLIDRGAPVNYVSSRGMTPLNMALLARDRATVELLVAEGADLTLTGPDGIPPIRHATEWGDRRVLEIFRARGITGS